jgi:hypothetical protein
MSEPSLRQQAPSSLHRAGHIRETFHQANDGTSNEAKRDSEMVKRDKPFPELKPNYSRGLKRSSFNREWLREQRAAKMADFANQRQAAPHQKSRSEPVIAR